MHLQNFDTVDNEASVNFHVFIPMRAWIADRKVKALIVPTERALHTTLDILRLWPASLCLCRARHACVSVCLRVIAHL